MGHSRRQCTIGGENAAIRFQADEAEAIRQRKGRKSTKKMACLPRRSVMLCVVLAGVRESALLSAWVKLVGLDIADQIQQVAAERSVSPALAESRVRRSVANVARGLLSARAGYTQHPRSRFRSTTPYTA